MCVICLSEENLDTVILCCYNMVHKLCLNNWLRVNNKCPVCRNKHIKELLQNISDHSDQSRQTSSSPSHSSPPRQPRQPRQRRLITTTTQTITIEINKNGIITRYTL